MGGTLVLHQDWGPNARTETVKGAASFPHHGLEADRPQGRAWEASPAPDPRLPALLSSQSTHHVQAEALRTSRGHSDPCGGPVPRCEVWLPWRGRCWARRTLLGRSQPVHARAQVDSKPSVLPPSSRPLVQSPRQPVSCTDWLGLRGNGTALLGPTGPWVWTDQGPRAFFLQELAPQRI